MSNSKKKLMLELNGVGLALGVMRAYTWTDYSAIEDEGGRWQRTNSNSLGVK